MLGPWLGIGQGFEPRSLELGFHELRFGPKHLDLRPGIEPLRHEIRAFEPEIYGLGHGIQLQRFGIGLEGGEFRKRLKEKRNLDKAFRFYGRVRIIYLFRAAAKN